MAATGYTRTAIGLHWLMAAMIAALFVAGKIMADMPLSIAKLKLVSWHKWAGVTLFGLVWLRLAWRLSFPAPSLPDTMPAWQARAAHSAHWLLYLLMIGSPLTGWMLSSALGVPTVPFGLDPLRLPDLFAKDKALAETLRVAHITLTHALALLAAGHAAVAIRHHVSDRDDVLARMLPFLSRTNPGGRA